ncbi:MAG: hypothetical protein RLZZ262_569 [Bacteroidota bacterium]|jgi:hypothetical protein
MKKMITAVLAIVCSASAFAQSDSLKVAADTTKMKIGDTRIILIDDDPTNDSTSVEYTYDGPSDRYELTHFAGVDLGMNFLLNSSGNTDFDSTMNWLDLDYARSLTWRINFWEEKVRLYKDYVGLMVGAGITYNSYGLRRNVSVITTDSTGTTGIPVDPSVRDFTKNKLRATYLNVPVMIEINTSDRVSKSFHISAGVMTGLKIGSLTRQKWEDDGNKHNEAVKADYNFSQFTLDASVRIGYGKFTVFANYGLTPLFKKDDGPEVYPVSVGLQVAPF